MRNPTVKDTKSPRLLVALFREIVAEVNANKESIDSIVGTKKKSRKKLK